ncbi:hypothetical protein TcasGA2_TC006079 [Tribolium castaneum]|uniref:Uncharacterized protein n=1 Tax=Tribolium castaneum TaxID=7070 RepID=D6WYM8_TRICA|nr:hypothetical protein TcasGA2_TC006079 [Tribolium castaneum]
MVDFQSKCTVRAPKISGSIKLQGACPYRIRAEMCNATGEVLVTFTATHEGHKDELSCQPLSETEQTSIVEQIKMGISYEVILKKAREMQIDECSRLNLLTIKDIRYLAEKHGLQGKGTKKDDFALGYMNEEMKYMLQTYGKRIVCLDGTHGTNPYNFELTTLLVLDDLNIGYPTVFLISNRKDTVVQKVFLAEIKKKIENLVPQHFMTDDTLIYYNAWTSIKDVYWKKKKEGKHRTGEAAKRTTKWEHMDALAFLDKVTTYRQTVTNVTTTNEEDNKSSQAADEVVDEDVVENRDETLEGEASQDTETVDEMAESQYRECGGNTVESPCRPPRKRKTTNEKLLDTIKKRAEGRSVLFKKLESAIEDKPHPIKLFFASMAETVMLFPPALAARTKMRVMEVIHELELENYGASSTSAYDSLSRVPTSATSLSSTSSYHPTRRKSDTTTSYIDSCYSAPSSVEPPRVYEDCADLFSSTTFQ